jgi:hypothetical protein
MPADTSILMGYRPPQIEMPDVQNARAAQAINAQQQNMLGAIQLGEAARANQVRNNLRKTLSEIDPNMPEDAVNALIDRELVKTGDINQVMAHRKNVAQIQAEKAKLTKEKSLTDKADVELKAEKLKLFTTQLPIIAQNPTDQAIGQWASTLIQNGLMDENQAKASVSQMLALPPEQRSERLMQSALNAKDALSRLEPKTDIGKLMFERDKLPADDPRRKTYDAAILKATTQSPGTNVNVSVSTEKKYGEKFAGNIADADVSLKTAAEAAPTLAENSNRISQILKSGQVFTGTGANIKLQLAKALKLAGGTDDEAIANTETLISSLASQTLANIKSSGLGSGQGFTDKDREFLQAASAGTITLDSKTLQRLSDLSYKTAVASANKWKERVDKIPNSAIEATGISREAIKVPPRAGDAPKPSAVRSAADAILSGSKK